MGRRLDAVGAGLLIVAVGWTLFTGVTDGARPVPVLLALVLAGAAFVAGRLLARGQGDARVPGALVVLAGTVAVVAGRRSLIGGAGEGPLGYSNANGTLFALVTLATLLAALAMRRPQPRRRALLVMAFFLVVTLTSGSAGAAAVLVLVLALLVLFRLVRASHLVALAGAAVVVAAIGATVVVSDRLEPYGSGSLQVRRELWREARDLIADHPARGVGPGRFETMSEVSDDPDLRWAHSGYLHQGAEQGAVGLLLLMGLIGWGLARCWATRDGTLAPAVGAAAIIQLALHATVDYVLHFPALVAATAFIAGAATAGVSRESPGSRPPLR